MIHGLPPIFDKSTKVLILGSFPGKLSLKQKKYYAAPNNDFWKLIGRILNLDLPGMPYRCKITTLLKSGIGLWDIYSSVNRIGSMDVNITDGTFNDFKRILHTATNLKVICFNGKTAAEHSDRFRNLGLPMNTLISSSGAARRYQDKRVIQWQKLASFIKD